MTPQPTLFNEHSKAANKSDAERERNEGFGVLLSVLGEFGASHAFSVTKFE